MMQDGGMGNCDESDSDDETHSHAACNVEGCPGSIVPYGRDSNIGCSNTREKKSSLQEQHCDARGNWNYRVSPLVVRGQKLTHNVAERNAKSSSSQESEFEVDFDLLRQLSERITVSTISDGSEVSLPFVDRISLDGNQTDDSVFV